MPLWQAFVFFQVGWFTVILGSQSFWYLFVIPLFILFLFLESKAANISRKQLVTSILLAISGFSFDSILQVAGVIQFSSSEHVLTPLAPMWLLLMWLWFAITFAACFRWLKGRSMLAVTIAALFGPGAYWGASNLADVQILSPLVFFPASMIFWGFLFYCIFAINSLSTRLFSVYSNQSTAQ